MTIVKKILNRFGHLINTNRLIVAFFGNTLGFSININWKRHHNNCKSSYPSSSKNEIAILIRKTGLGVLGCFECGVLSKLVSEEFNKERSTQLTLKELNRANCGKFSKEIYSILEQISPIIENYYQSFFQPYWISIQENFPGKASFDTSFGWHIDDNPKELMKIFIYINDVEEKNGAFRALPLIHTKNILRKGFVSYSEKDRLKNQSLVNNYIEKNKKSLLVVEGNAGTVFMFDNNLVHKGTLPIVGYRQLVQVEVYPSDYKFTEAQVFNALTRPILYDYPRNPYFNDIAG